MKAVEIWGKTIWNVFNFET